ncbi:MAG TPA: tetratricopeptide repeat protein [Polyangia bacterium]|nr:tetratricopeptide repeat protein [Polyangia bacterium]
MKALARVLAVVFAVVFALGAFAAPALADNPQDAVRARMQEGETRYQNQDYRAAIEAFDVVVHDPIATREDRVRAYEYLGMSWLILGKKPKARAAFEELLAIDPHYTLSDPSHSPKLREFFESVRTSFVPGYGRSEGEAELEHSAPTGATAGRALEMQVVVIRGAELVHAVTLFARRQGLLEYGPTPMRGDANRWYLKYAPPRDVADYTLEYYVEARDDKGRVVARVASPERPIPIAVHGVPIVVGPTPWYKRWYVWAAVGAAVAGGAIAGAVAGTAERAPKGSLPPGTVSLGLRF